jgi:hypothetical protein
MQIGTYHVTSKYRKILFSIEINRPDLLVAGGVGALAVDGLTVGVGEHVVRFR